MCSEDFDFAEFYGQYKTLNDLKQALKNKEITISRFKTDLIRLSSHYEDIKMLLEGLQFIVSQEHKNPAEFLTYITSKQKEQITKLLNKGENISLREFLFVLHSLGMQMKIYKIDFNYLDCK